jgi:ABC-2 type transport system ATP-binding protein
LETHGLGKRYGRRWALRDCTLALPEGRVVALVGANGAGKSTLLQLAVGLLAPSAGTVTVFGSRPQENAAVLSAVGFVAQTAPLYYSFTVDELIAFGGKLNPRFEAVAARRKLSALGIDCNSLAGHLSGGQQAQVALALALAKRPRLLILDEPVASLDPLARREFLQSLMEAVAEEGTTVVLSSHLTADLERVCDYLVVLSASRVQVLGDIEGLLASHALLTGPASNASSLALSAPVVAESATGRQATLLARTNGARLRLPDGWTSGTIALDELVLAYMRNPLTGALPGPQLLASAL